MDSRLTGRALARKRLELPCYMVALAAVSGLTWGVSGYSIGRRAILEGFPQEQVIVVPGANSSEPKRDLCEHREGAGALEHLLRSNGVVVVRRQDGEGGSCYTSLSPMGFMYLRQES